MYLLKSKKLFLILAVFIALISLMQCKKEGATIKQLDRTFKGIPDSTKFSPFYDTTLFAYAGTPKAANDYIVTRGVKTILTAYCVSSNCHAGKFEPNLSTYEDIKELVTPGSPETSKLWDYLTTNDFNKAMPPVNVMNEMSETDKTVIYNWIKNGAKATPDLVDYRPAAIFSIVNGCTSGNCHAQTNICGQWARKGMFACAATDTVQFSTTNLTTGAVTVRPQLTNTTLLNQVWGAYKDSVRKFYQDTLLNASYRIVKQMTTPWTSASTRGPLASYDDIIFDIWYPKSVRSNTNPLYSVNGVQVKVRGDYLNSTSTLISRIDSTLVMANPSLVANPSGTFQTSNNGDMAWGDGSLSPSEIAIIKAWYFADPNIPDVWKFGQNNAGIFKYKISGYIIKK